PQNPFVILTKGQRAVGKLQRFSTFFVRERKTAELRSHQQTTRGPDVGQGELGIKIDGLPKELQSSVRRFGGVLNEKRYATQIEVITVPALRGLSLCKLGIGSDQSRGCRAFNPN